MTGSARSACLRALLRPVWRALVGSEYYMRARLGGLNPVDHDRLSIYLSYGYTRSAIANKSDAEPDAPRDQVAAIGFLIRHDSRHPARPRPTGAEKPYSDAGSQASALGLLLAWSGCSSGNRVVSRLSQATTQHTRLIDERMGEGQMRIPCSGGADGDRCCLRTRAQFRRARGGRSPT